MDTTPHNPDGAVTASTVLPRPAPLRFEQGAACTLGMKWQALHQAADAVAAIAGAEAESLPQDVQGFPIAIGDAGAPRRAIAERGIEDLSALMEAGLSALLAALEHGTRPDGAAQALWREFQAARDAILQLAPASSGEPPFTA
ncbi:hypothetical protein [Novosphingobium beihaiensis]|uniref:Uncharacterized protein n=1 Tax=Novosphingobium beihaiensis TaxID=2930389 RepID=A0ABT0BVC9_9SPHN|nr:hypothetical protein [Novosphingobium beihaiensis]MCJ2188594.1 hypothetical protein [Novosphingobium beihaiensis]